MEINIKMECIAEIQISNNAKKIAIIGENGSGKTTLMRCLSGNCFPKEGMIKYDDSSCFTFPMNYFKYLGWRKFIKQNVLYVDHSTLLYNDLSIIDNIKYFSNLGHFDNARVYHILESINVKESLYKPIKFLSDGTKQKVLLALALSSDKKYILLDEPDKYLDNNTCNFVMEEIRKNDEKEFVISTHINKRELEKVFNYIYTVVQKEEVR